MQKLLPYQRTLITDILAQDGFKCADGDIVVRNEDNEIANVCTYNFGDTDFMDDNPKYSEMMVTFKVFLRKNCPSKKYTLFIKQGRMYRNYSVTIKVLKT